MSHPTRICCALAIVLVWSGGALASEPPLRYGPYFIGHEVEPAMDYGGRVMVSLHRALADAATQRLPRRLSALAPAYELPLAVLVSTLQHEVHGHGARAREFNLRPSYGFGLDFSAYTTISRDPESNEQLLALAAGGTEANGVMARRMLLDFCAPSSAPASGVPLMFMAKLDLSVYIAVTGKPRADRPSADEDDDRSSFTEEYEQGNDIAIYLATRQAARRGADPDSVWRRDYVIDFEDSLLDETYRHAQDAALWNALDPMLWTSLYQYIRHHAIGGERLLPAPLLPLGRDFGIGIATRAAIEPQAVSRILDFYVAAPGAVFSVYGRDLRSTTETTYGFGVGAQRVRIGPRASLSLCGDYWTVPQAPESPDNETGWNVGSEIEFPLGPHIGAALKAGCKSEGYFPGAPLDGGLYLGGGLTASF